MRENDFLKTQEPFRSNGFEIIKTMLKWHKEINTAESKCLVDEILHSIFFMGKINKVPYSPEEIIGDKDILAKLKKNYPRPFEFYSTHLPMRSPFSCVVDMVVLQKGQGHEEEIKESLGDLVNTLENKFLVSTNICVSQQKSPNSARYYGVSMSTTGPNAGRIAIGASCFSSWDDYVSNAVMTYCLHNVKKPHYDGTIKVPKNIRCETFNICKGGLIPPCKSCSNLFGLETNDKKEWPYGNCAEAESLSKMLKKEAEVKKQIPAPRYTPDDWKNAKNSVQKELGEVLRMIKFKNWKNIQYYSPVIQFP